MLAQCSIRVQASGFNERSYLHYSLTANHVRPRSNSHPTPIGILDPLTRGDKFTEIIKSARPIGIRKHHILTPNMAQAMCDCTTFTAVVSQSHETNSSRRDMHALVGMRSPGPGVTLRVQR